MIFQVRPHEKEGGGSGGNRSCRSDALCYTFAMARRPSPIEPLEALFRRIDDRRDDIVELTRSLVRIPTLNPPGLHYLDACELVRRRLSKSGFRCMMLRAEGAVADSDRHPRWNLLARRDGAEPGNCVHFNSHIDVVQVGQGWSIDPFEGVVRDERVYGRGTCDMKGGLAASIVAAECFAETFPGFAGAIEISATADEESGGYGGVAWMAEQGYFSPDRVQHVIIPEPLNKNRICLGHRGVWWAEIETKGRIAHGSMPFLGDCAVRHMGTIIAELEESLFPLLAGKRTAMPVVPEGARQSTLNLNAIHGGEPEQEEDFGGFPASCVPDRCTLTLDRRFLAEESLEEVRSEVLEAIERAVRRRPTLKYNLKELYSVLPSMTDESAPVVKAVDCGIRRVLGVSPDLVVSPGTYDQKHIDRIGKLRNCIAYGPGVLDFAHQPDEWVGIDDMLDSSKVMGHALTNLLACNHGPAGRPV